MKILIIRFSSIGDIIQCMSITEGLYNGLNKPTIDWITRSDMSSLLKTDPSIHRVWEFDRADGFFGLIKMALELRKEKYDLIYDAHLNIRSITVRFILCPLFKSFGKRQKSCIIRKKNRLKRFLFFNFKVRSALKLPFRGMISFQKPLKVLNIDFHPSGNKKWLFPERIISRVNEMMLKEQVQINNKTITIIPSAAWELKRWPIENWKDLVQLMPEYNFIILAGPDDDFTAQIKNIAPERVLNLAGKTNLNESFYLVSMSNFVVSADTGFLHAADLFGKDGIALMGPTAFGHTSGDTIKVLEIDLPCRPCTKEGNSECKIAETKKCLADITAMKVRKTILDMMHES